MYVHDPSSLVPRPTLGTRLMIQHALLTNSVTHFSYDLLSNQYTQGPPTKSASMDFSHGNTASARVSSATGEIDSKGMNNLSGSSGLNCTPKSGSISSFDERDRELDHSEGKLVDEHSSSSGYVVPIPQLHTAVDGNRPRQ